MHPHITLHQLHADRRENITPEGVRQFIQLIAETQGKVAVILSAQLLHRDRMIQALHLLGILKKFLHPKGGDTRQTGV